jgi:hypothetical protein
MALRKASIDEILSHNVRGAKERKEVNGTQSNMKFKYIALYMEDNNIVVCLIHQTWLEGDKDHWNINGITFFTHARKKELKQRTQRFGYHTHETPPPG